MSWELAIERLINATSDRFAKVDNRLEELASHIDKIQDQLCDLCKVISSNHMPIDSIMNGENVVCENGLHVDENDESNVCFNEEMSISHDYIFGTSVES